MDNIKDFRGIMIYNPNGDPQINIEDLSIFIDLEVEIKNRDFITNSQKTGKIFGISYSSENDETSFYKGTKTNGENYITDFSDSTTYKELEPSMNEGVCIENISIDYKSWYTPLIKIRFVDVKGTGVFMEMQKNAENNITNSQNFFSSFFMMPYPTYTLSVKGYYGIPSELRLYCTDVRSEYDNNKGNFILETTFIGYDYAFLSDFEMSQLITGPYINKNGSSYWDSRNFQFKNEDGSFTPMKKIHDLYIDLKKYEIEIGEKLKDDKEIQEIERQTKDRNEVLSLITKIKNITEIQESGINKDNIYSFFVTKENTHIIYLSKENKDNVLLKYINEIFYSSKRIKSLNKYNILQPNVSYFKIFENNKEKSYSEYLTFLAKNGLKDYKFIFGDLEDNSEITEKVIYLKSLSQDYNTVKIIDLSSLILTLNKYNDDINNKTQENIKIFRDKINYITKSSLNFTPSINNFIRLISAHIETFTHNICECAKNIDPNRKLSSYGLNSYMVDNKDNDDKFYPFSQINKIEDNTLKETWPNENSLNGKIIDETELIHSIISGQVEIINQNTTIDSVFNKKKYIPLNYYDFNSNKSPYLNVLNGNVDDVILNACLRMMLSISTNNFLNDSDKTKFIELAGKIEGYNLYNTFPNGKKNEIISNLNVESFFNYAKKIVLKEENNKIKLSFVKNKYNDISVDYIPLESIKSSEINGFTIDTIASDKKSLFFSEKNFITTSYISEKEEKFFKYNNPNYEKLKNINIINENDLKNYSELLNNLINNELNSDFNYLKKNWDINDDFTYHFLCRKDFRADGFLSLYKSEGDYVNKELIKLESTYLGDGGKTNYKLETQKFLKNINLEYNQKRKNTFELIYNEKQNLHYPVFRVDENCNGIFLSNNNNTCSIFGTKLYNNQKSIYIKGFLFLHSLPMDFDKIENLFDNLTNQKMLSLPKSITLFIGSLFYRFKNKEGDIISTEGYSLPNTHDVLFNSVSNKNVMYLPSKKGERLVKINPKFFKVNENIQNIFIENFKKWVDDYFLEIDSYSSIENHEEIFDLIKNKSDITLIKRKLRKKNISDIFSIYKNVSLGSDITKSLFLENNIDSPSVYETIRLLKEKDVIYSIGTDVYEFNKENKEITVSKNDILLYVENLLKIFKNNSVVSKKTLESNLKTLNSDIICMSKYSYVKSVYDKWLCGIDESFFINFHEKFDVMDRAYNTEIGDKLIINFTKILEDIVNSNESKKAINVISSVLSDNNFSFIPITGVKFYKEKNDLSKLFSPLSYLDIKDKSDGVSFMCIYIGKPASYSNITYNSLYRENSFNICEPENMSESITLPYDFSISKTNVNKFLKVPSFLVSIGNQKESFFKKISVNMNTPTNTDDSINSVYNLSKLSPGKKISLGQNLYNIYSNRSFNCEIEMMGNAQIQPYMYFQLTNMPMWNGTYLIIGVSHTVSAGNFKTKITGVKMSYPYPYINDGVYDSPIDTGVETIENNINIIDTYNEKEFTTSIDGRLIGNNDRFIYGNKPNSYPYNLVYKNYNISNFLRRMSPTRYEKDVPEEIIRKIKLLIDKIIIPIEKSVGKIFVINSCYRSDSNGSQHQKGEAVDIGFTNNKYVNSERLYNHIRSIMKNNGFVYDQLIFEYKNDLTSAWVHISYKENGVNRLEDFIINI